VNLQLEPETLEPLIRRVVEETLARVADAQAALPNGRVAYSEEEAAELLGLEANCLREERVRGPIQASKIVGRRVRYLREDLVGYMIARRQDLAEWKPAEKRRNDRRANQ